MGRSPRIMIHIPSTSHTLLPVFHKCATPTVVLNRSNEFTKKGQISHKHKQMSVSDIAKLPFCVHSVQHPCLLLPRISLSPPFQIKFSTFLLSLLKKKKPTDKERFFLYQTRKLLKSPDQSSVCLNLVHCTVRSFR